MTLYNHRNALIVVTDNLIENKIFRSHLHHALFHDVESSCAQQCPADLKLGKEPPSGQLDSGQTEILLLSK